MSRIPVKQEGEFFTFDCPHCAGSVIVHNKETQCCIFRHGVYKSNYQQMNPHTHKEACEALSSSGQIVGCGKPFRFVYSPAGNYVEECGYI